MHSSKLSNAMKKALSRIFQPTCGEPPTARAVYQQKFLLESLQNANIQCVAWLSSSLLLIKALKSEKSRSHN